MSSFPCPKTQIGFYKDSCTRTRTYTPTKGYQPCFRQLCFAYIFVTKLPFLPHHVKYRFFLGGGVAQHPSSSPLKRIQSEYSQLYSMTQYSSCMCTTCFACEMGVLQSVDSLHRITYLVNSNMKPKLQLNIDLMRWNCSNPLIVSDNQNIVFRCDKYNAVQTIYCWGIIANITFNKLHVVCL